MKMTVGPLPPAVYWRRRAAVGAVLIAILLGFTTCQGGDSGGSSAAARSKSTPSPSSKPTASPTPSASTSAGLRAGSASASPIAAPAPATPREPAAAGTTPDCADADLRLTASLDRVTAAYGSMPKVHLTVSNAGSAACRRDVGANAQELRVMAGTRRLWSSDDCQPLRGTSVRTLQPGEKRVYTVTWSGKDSTPGCREARTRVSPGTYQLIARLDSLVSEPASFRIV